MIKRVDLDRVVDSGEVGLMCLGQVGSGLVIFGLMIVVDPVVFVILTKGPNLHF